MQCPLKSKRWARRKEARPQELLAAALDLFVERGFAATRLDDVAARAGVSKGTLYLYFANKEELFKAVVRENMLPVLDEAADLIQQHEGDSATLFQDIMLGWWERVGNTKVSGITKLIMAESGKFSGSGPFLLRRSDFARQRHDRQHAGTRHCTRRIPPDRYPASHARSDRAHGHADDVEPFFQRLQP